MKKTGLMMIALSVASLNLRPAINSVAPLIESIRTDLGMGAAIASLLTAIPVLCMGICSPLAVKAGGRWGIERIIGLSLLMVGAGTAMRLLTDTVLLLIATAFLAGIGIAFISPLLSGFIKQHFPNRVPSMISVYTVTLTLGAVFSSALSTPLQESFGSWRASLAFWALVAFASAAVWRFAVRSRSEPSAARADAARTEVRLPWGSGKAWILTLSFGLMAMLFYSCTAWLPQIIQGMGYPKEYAATALTIFVAAQIPIGLLFPVLLRKYPSRRLWLLVETTLELLGFLLLILHIAPWVAAALIGFGAGGLFSLNLLLPIDAADTAEAAASWSAMAQSVGYVIGAAGPFLLGWIHDATGSFASAVYGMIAIALLMMLVQLAATAAARIRPREAGMNG